MSVQRRITVQDEEKQFIVDQAVKLAATFVSNFSKMVDGSSMYGDQGRFLFTKNIRKISIGNFHLGLKRVTFATSPIRVQKPYPIYDQTGQNQLKLILRLLVLFLPDGYAMMMRPNKAETAVHGCHCPGDMAVRMRKVLARPWVGVSVCHLLFKLISYTLRAAHTTYLYSPYKGYLSSPPADR